MTTSHIKQAEPVLEIMILEGALGTLPIRMCPFQEAQTGRHAMLTTQTLLARKVTQLTLMNHSKLRLDHHPLGNPQLLNLDLAVWREKFLVLYPPVIMQVLMLLNLDIEALARAVMSSCHPYRAELQISHRYVMFFFYKHNSISSAFLVSLCCPLFFQVISFVIFPVLFFVYPRSLLRKYLRNIYISYTQFMRNNINLPFTQILTEINIY